MRIVQLIDSLQVGGAERMAVNYANALSKVVKFSGLIVTRKEGLLKEQITDSVQYLFLNRKKNLDFDAYLVSRKYLIHNKITHIQAHSSSFFWAFLLKLTIPNIKIIWHDHFGNRPNISNKQKFILQLCSLFFYRVLSVSNHLSNWAKKELMCKKILYLPNFVVLNEENNQVFLKGTKGKRILCLANLRVEKNHLMLLEVAFKLKKEFPEWTFHLIGNDNNDSYSALIKKKITELELEQNVFVYGSFSNVNYILNQSDIGVLTSNFEGLPMALLEYGFAGLPVVTTNVGEIPNVFKSDFGFMVEFKNEKLFLNALISLIKNPERKEKGIKFSMFVIEQFSENAILKKFLEYCV
ncbi:hypothetical protein BWK58_09180 [Flavobacterium columnare]|nr:hypothetical protein BWK58_09180 [Flavobacterium columnare]